jgi:hypothetical protein
MRYQSLLYSVAAAVALVACGGSSDDFWNVAPSAQSASLATPGSGTFTEDGRTVTLVGGNGGTAGCTGGQYGFTTSPCTVVATANDRRGTYTFDWTYSTVDTSGPSADIFGVVVDGKVMALSDPGGAQVQSGKATVTPTSSVAFFINCTDCTDGAAQATVSSFQQR